MTPAGAVRQQDVEIGPEDLYRGTVLRDALADMIRSHGFLPVAHVTLTYETGHLRHKSEVVQRDVEGLVAYLNTRAGGRRYSRKWKHSYFGYVVGVEFTAVGAMHVQMAVDNMVDFAALHSYWRRRHGFAWIRQVHGDADEVTRYVTKYVVKDGAPVVLWFQKRRRVVSMQGGMLSVEQPATA